MSARPPDDNLSFLDDTDPLTRAQAPENDSGNGRRFLARWGDLFRFVPDYGGDADKLRYAVFTPADDDASTAAGGPIDGCSPGVWTLKGGSAALVMASAISADIHLEAEAIEAAGVEQCDEKTATNPAAPKDMTPEKAHAKRVIARHSFAKGTGNYGKMKDMLALAGHHRRLGITSFDARPKRLAVSNGTLDLDRAAAGEDPLTAACPDDYLSRASKVKWDAQAKCPAWKDLVDKVTGTLSGDGADFQRDPAMAAYFQRQLGYLLLGENPEQRMFFWTGGGSNAKSTVISALAGVLGGHASDLNIQALLRSGERKAGDVATEWVEVYGARLVRISEARQGMVLGEAVVKDLTGGADPIQVRNLYGDPFSYVPQFTMIGACNTIPEIRSTDEGIWRRIEVVPFDVTFMTAARAAREGIDFDAWHPDFQARDVRDVTNSLAAERPAILAWMMDGYIDWLERGLDPPKRAMAAAIALRESSDTVKAFIDWACERSSDREDRVRAKFLYDCYCAWTAGAPVKAAAFKARMEEMGCPHVKSSVTYYGHLTWRDDPEVQALRDRAERVGGQG